MGFYIRKAIRVGPFRFNLSKSGIGVSAGIKGLRVGSGPRGNYVHMGRGGLYFRRSLDDSERGRSSHSGQSKQPRNDGRLDIKELSDIDSGSVLEMVDASSSELLAEFDSKRARLRALPIVVALSGLVFVAVLVGGAPAWIAALSVPTLLLLCWLTFLSDEIRKTTVIMYQLGSEIEQSFQSLHDEFTGLLSCSRIWHVEAKGETNDLKHNAGASTLIRRKPVDLQVGLPRYVKSNISVPMVPVGAQTLAFFPDRLLVFDSIGVGAVSYQDLLAKVSEANTIEHDEVPRDASVIGSTWRYVNKSGGPDRRFRDNREIPICSYDQLQLSSSTGLNEMLQFSRKGHADGFALTLAKMAG